MKVSSPEKVMFPADGITKREMVEYYARVAKVLVPHLEGRPLTLQRFPSGIEGNGFMQKNAPDYFPDSIERVEIPKEGGTTTYPLCDSAEDLAYLANQNTVTFHIWTSRLPHPDTPDRLVLDLDPADKEKPPRRAARAARQAMEDVGLEAGLMTTGSSGYHVVAPLRTSHDYETVGLASRLLAGVVSARHPEEMTTEFLKKDREGRVFVDWLRNRPAQSVVAPWSLRPRPTAPVAMPIAWEELDDTDPQAWTMATSPSRVDDPDPWPPAADLELAAVITLAEDHDVDGVEPFDRFGRKRGTADN